MDSGAADNIMQCVLICAITNGNFNGIIARTNNCASLKGTIYQLSESQVRLKRATMVALFCF